MGLEGWPSLQLPFSKSKAFDTSIIASLLIILFYLDVIFGKEGQAESPITASTFFAADALSDPDMSFAISPRSSTLISPILNLVTRMPVIMASFFFFAFLANFPHLRPGQLRVSLARPHPYDY